MTVSTLNRRSFFQKLRNATTDEPEKRVGIFGEMKPLLPIGNQTLPLVPPPTITVTINGGLEPYAGPWDFEQAAHLLRRTGFGVKKADLDLLMGMTMNDAVDHVLRPIAAPLPPVNNYYDDVNTNNDYDYYDAAVTVGQTWVNANYDGDAEGLRIESFRGWWVNLMVNQEASILERMTLFWHNHFATQTEAVFYGKTNYIHNKLLRQYALGNFKDFVKEITLDPMMLYYLNGYLNSKEAPDENYARELQELFTIGKDNPDHYTEGDVVAAARILTGWRVDFVPNTLYFDGNAHDTDDKQFSAFYGNTVITGGIGQSGANAELDALIDMIFQKNEVAEFICRKLYRWFIYYHIDAAAEQNVIQPLAQLFRSNGYEILPVLETLLKSTHFFDALNKGCYIKTPVDFVVGTMRSFNLTIPSITYWDDFAIKYELRNHLSDLQMLPGDPPNVAGWQAFRQVPQYYRMWINGDTARNRNFYIARMFSGAIATSNDNVLRIDPIAFASQFSDPSNATILVDELVRFLLPQPISDLKKTLLKNILLSGLSSESYWTIAWFDYINDPDGQMSFVVVNTRLTTLIRYILNLPEYQLA